ncbi:hypothetical protein F4604DRAFT_1933107 [Suillus subluteus]|nr:hypothetical protein F4604DRAFT_1933107 [Suillus subluteus]
MDTDASWSQQSFDAGQKRSNHPVKTSEEKGWKCLLRSIYYAMCNIIREANDESSQSDSLNPLPFNVIPEPWYWSSEFTTTPIPDTTNSCKPDFVLMDFRLKKNQSGEKTWADVLTNIEITKSELVQGKDIPIFLGVATKGYLIMREQPWRHFVILFSIANLQFRTHYMVRSGMIISQPLPIGANAVRFVDVLNTITLSDLASLGFDPTIHICTNLCSAGSHNDLPEGIDQMPEGTKGWVMDNNSEVYWIMAILWKSHGLFSHGTVCYHVQDRHGTEFALKDCWVDAENLDHEVTLLQAVHGIPNVVSLKKYWDDQYAGQTDCTERIREHISENLPEAPIYSNKSLPELPPQRAPQKGPSAKAGSAHGGRDPTSHGPSCRRSPTWSTTVFTRSRSLHSSRGHIPPPVDHLVDAPRLGQQLSLLAQGLRVQAGVVITLSTDRLLDLHIGVHPVDHLLDIPRHSHHIGKPLNPITCGLIPLFQAVLTLMNPLKLGFYPPCWQAFLQAAKLEMCLQAVLTHPIPEHQHALQLAREVLDAVLWSYHSKKIKMENSYFPQYRAQVSCLLCNDLFTFRTELKKIIISIAKQLYGIFPKANMGQKDALQQQVTKAVSKLIKSGDYLRLPDWSSGKYKNFVLQVLKDACIDFYYGNGKKALKLTEEFCKRSPSMHSSVWSYAKGILTGFCNTGTDKVPDLSADKCRSDFDTL